MTTRAVTEGGTVTTTNTTQVPPVASLRFHVLGHMRVQVDDETQSFGSPQAQAFLAVLLFRPGRAGTLAELVDGIWGDEPPDTAVATVRTHAWKWRRFFASRGATRDVLRSHGDGYRLALSKPLTDVDIIEALAVRAAEAKKEGRYAEADALFQEALERWSGDPLAQIPGDFAKRERTRLTEMYNALVEERCEVRLALGKASFVVPELTLLTAANPLRQRGHRLLMEALQATGRQAEALAVFDRLRRALAQGHGLDPEPALTRLHQSILTGEASEQPAPEAAWPVPRQLPCSVADFVGKKRELALVSGALLRRQSAAPTVVVVDGPPGSGKSTLAVHAAHQVRHAFPAGVLYADLSPGGTAADPAVVLTGFLLSLGIPRSHLPDRTSDLSALFRSMTDDRQLLIVLDQAHGAAQVQPLLPGSSRCAALVTSTARLQGLPVTRRTTLRPGSSKEALDLLTSVLGPDRVRAELSAAEALAQACGRLPLILRTVGDWLAGRPHWSLETLLPQVCGSAGFRFGQWEAVTASFERSVRLLGPERSDIWRRLALMAAEITPASVATSLSLPRERAKMLLEGLVDASLLEPAGAGSYTIPDLLRQFARHTSVPRGHADTSWPGAAA
ncbi:BTAD domain-containing putative transcriptional regulator [Streptomyces sp. NPDC018347]|uniref:AfsR/SARP family transcriptional regulator n=1 Tax=Streptomyces sp. NPDC018347 TaxID=3157193 RepID=UPI0033D8BD61